MGLWTSFPLKDQVMGQSDPECDIYGFYLLSLSNKLTLVPGFTLYTYPDAEPQNGYYRTRFEPNLALSYSLGPVQITPKLYYDFQLKGPTAELTASFAIPLANFGTELDFTGTVGTFKWTDARARSPIDTRNWGDYFVVGVSVPFQFSVSSKITLGWSYSKGTNNYLKQGSAAKFRNPAATGRGFLSLGYSRTF